MDPIDIVALVDDDEVYNFLTKEIIGATNLVRQIKVFNNGMDAIHFIEANEHEPQLLPDIILLDLNMPVMDGWQFLDEYLKIKPYIGKKIAIFVSSSSISPADIIKAQKINEVTDYIIKPLTKEKFERIVSILQERQY